MSPSESESSSTFQILFLVDTVLLDLSWGIADTAVLIPRPFTTLRREVEWLAPLVLLLLTTFMGTTCELSDLIFLFLCDVTTSSQSLD